MRSHSAGFLDSIIATANALFPADLDRMADLLAERNGRLFILGVGGSAANASHAVNDFRKLCGIEAYCPSDNVAELTARTNDDGWETTYSEWLVGSHINNNDAILVLSVGGGDAERGVSVNIVNAINTAKRVNAAVFGIVGPNGGHTAQHGDVVVRIPVPSDAQESLLTPISEAFQSIVWHALVSHPALQKRKAKWESMT